MSELFSLICPTCGAGLDITGDDNQFRCEHCGNRYLIDHKVRELDDTARKKLRPLITYAQTTGQWLRVAEYDVLLHQIMKTDDAFYIEVEYENKTADPIKYRHDQWIIFDDQGHTFEAVKDFNQPDLYRDEKIYLGMTRVLNPGMQLRGWLAFVLPASTEFEYLQFSAGWPIKTVEFRFTT